MMTTTLTDEQKRQLADVKAGRPVQPTTEPVESFTDKPKGK